MPVHPPRRPDPEPRPAGRAAVAPAARDGYRVVAVCTGNICRSPMAEAVLRARFAAAGLAGRVAVSSAGTGGWHVGDDADPRALAALRAAGYPLAHAARQFDPAWFADHDLVLALDRLHDGRLRALAADPAVHARVRLLRSFDPSATDPDVPDPYYGRAEHFAEVLAMVEAAADGVVAFVGAELAARDAAAGGTTAGGAEAGTPGAGHG